MDVIFLFAYCSFHISCPDSMSKREAISIVLAYFVYKLEQKEISGLGHHPFLLLWTTEVKS